MITLIVGFLATVLVARYLGPEDFGLVSYALSLSSLFAVAGHMGLGGLVVREIVNHPGLRAETLGTAAGLKLLGMGIGFLGLVTYAAFYEGIQSIEFWAICLAGSALLFNPLEVVESWFQAFVQAKYVTATRVVALFATAALKVLLVAVGASALFFVGASLFQAMLTAILFFLFFNWKAKFRISEWQFSWSRARALLSQGWLVYLGSIFAMVYLKIDQVMLRWWHGADAVGVYAVAAQLSEAWYFVPTAIVASFFPKLIELRKADQALFYRRFQQLLDLLLAIAVVVALTVVLFANWVILLFFGDNYAESASVLVVHIWAAIFIFMRAAFSRWILIENLLVFSLITQASGALINVLMNWILIPEYGVQGAAYATLLSYAMSSFFSLILYRKTRYVFWMMCKSFFSPLRYATLFLRKVH